jgi:hypothetical protein
LRQQREGRQASFQSVEKSQVEKRATFAENRQIAALAPSRPACTTRGMRLQRRRELARGARTVTPKKKEHFSPSLQPQRAQGFHRVKSFAYGVLTLHELARSIKKTSCLKTADCRTISFTLAQTMQLFAKQQTAALFDSQIFGWKGLRIPKSSWISWPRNVANWLTAPFRWTRAR